MGVSKSAMDLLQKSFGKENVMKLSDSSNSDIEFYSTGSMYLDYIMGGGFAKGRIVEVYGPESVGKAQPLSSKILTPSGWKTMGDMVIGSIVSTPDGGSSTVVGVFPQGVKKVYEITFDDKSTVRCCKDHLWTVETRDSKKNLSQVMSLKDIMKTGLKTSHGTRKYRVPKVEPIVFEDQGELPLDPWLLGALLGDGSFISSTVKYTTSDKFMVEKLEKVLTPLNMKVKKVKGSDYDYSLSKNKNGRSQTELTLRLTKLGLMGKYSYEKVIPGIYLLATVEERVQLLQGLLDSDGTVGSKGGMSCTYTSTSMPMAKQVVDLCRSLGVRAIVSPRTTQYTNSAGKKVDGRESYRVSMLFNESEIVPFSLPRHVKRFIKNKQETSRNCNYSRRYIESIKLVDEQECQCIMIGHPESLYITDNYIPTHNTTTTVHAIAEAQKAGVNCGFIDAEHAFDTSYAKDLGVDVDELVISQPDNGEQAIDLVLAMIKTGEFGLVVVDSTNALTPKSELEGEASDSSMGKMARLMSKGLRMIKGEANKNDCTVIFISQLREKIGVIYGSPEVIGVGNAMKFYASQRLDVRRSTPITDKDGEAVGHTMKFKTKKNKLYPPFKSAEVILKYGKGYDSYSEVADLASQIGVINKSGSWYSYDGTKIGQGVQKVITMLEDNPELFEEIKSNVIKGLKEQ